MRSSNRRYLYPVDQLRAAAALLVVLYHSTDLISAQRRTGSSFTNADWPYSRNPIKTIVFEGHTGVALFMVLSGFIFTVGTLGNDVKYGPFLRNRLLRIYPLYLALVLIGASTQQFSLIDLARAILPFANYFPGFGGAWGAMFWAVAVEVQFYLIFPLLLRLLNRYGPLSLVRIIVAAAMLRTFAWISNPKIDLNQLTYYSLAGRIDQFLWGMLAAVVFVRYRKFLTPSLLAVTGVCLVAALWMFNQLHGFAAPAGWRVVWVDLEGVLWASFVAAYVAVFEQRKGLIARVIAAVGERSYSIYLLHFVIVTWVAERARLYIPVGGAVTGSLLTGLLIVAPIAVAASFVTFDGIEKPFLSLRVRYIIDSRPDPPQQDAPSGTREASSSGTASIGGAVTMPDSEVTASVFLSSDDQNVAASTLPPVVGAKLEAWKAAVSRPTTI